MGVMKNVHVCHCEPAAGGRSNLLNNCGDCRVLLRFARSPRNDKVFHFIFIAVILFSLLLPAKILYAEEEARNLMKGQSETISVDYEIGDAAVADPKVCDYLVGRDRRSVYLNALSGGETIVTLWDMDGKERDEIYVRVATGTLSEVLDRIKNEFGEIDGLKISVRGGHVEMDGEVAEPQDFKRIDAASRGDARIINRVRIARDVVREIADAVGKAIDVPGITVRDVRGRIVLGGLAYSKADARRALEIAKLYSQDVMDLIEVRETGRQVGRGKMIELTFHMMEVKKSALRALGINWAPGSFPASGSGNAAMNPAAGAGSITSIFGGLGRELLGFVLGLVPKINFLRETGGGRMLENPSVIVKSGEEAKIFSGTEVPYYRGSEVQFKKVGIEIDAVPIESSNGVDIKLNATLSAPSSSLRGALDTHTVSTSAICPPGQSIALGNIIRNGEVKMKNRVPSNMDASSALFTLFLSKDFQSNRSEFVIFVTPRIIDSPSSAEAKLHEFLVMEESMIHERSKKEFSEYAAKNVGVINEPPEGAAKKKNVNRRRRWQ